MKLKWLVAVLVVVLSPIYVHAQYSGDCVDAGPECSNNTGTDGANGQPVGGSDYQPGNGSSQDPLVDQSNGSTDSCSGSNAPIVCNTDPVNLEQYQNIPDPGQLSGNDTSSTPTVDDSGDSSSQPTTASGRPLDTSMTCCSLDGSTTLDGSTSSGPTNPFKGTIDLSSINAICCSAGNSGSGPVLDTSNSSGVMFDNTLSPPTVPTRPPDYMFVPFPDLLPGNRLNRHFPTGTIKNKVCTSVTGVMYDGTGVCTQ